MRRLSLEKLEDRKLLAAIHPLPLGTLDGTNGFRLVGIDVATGTGIQDNTGRSVSSAGDINGDGFDDVIIGAPAGDGGAIDSGESYVVFGKSGGFNSSIPLSSLNGSNGFRIDGIDEGDFAGIEVSGAGDMNGDGFDDLIIGARRGDAGGPDSGEGYVVFGKSTGFASVLALSTLDGSNGFRVDGIDADDYWNSLKGAGDVNGDGFDDLIIGARDADPQGIQGAGESYVLFGKSGGFASAISMSSLDGSNGFRIDGMAPEDGAGYSVSSAGDVNGDGFDDLIIGAATADPKGKNLAGEIYVLFGKSGGFVPAFSLSTLNGSNGFRISGADSEDWFGNSVSSAGDVNGDGFDDILIGAFRGDSGAIDSGETYVIFGKSGGFAPVLDLSALDGTNGFRLDGVDAIDWSGFSVSSAGDVNGDGFDDFVIGALRADAGAIDSGEIYVILGKSGGFAPALDLSTLDGTNGFRLDGVDALDWSGFSVSSAGDVNGDGFDDLIIGAPQSGGALRSGQSYVVFGGNFTGGVETQVGNSAANTLAAVNGSALDVLVGGQGDDILISDGGDDVLIGGHGDDVLAISDVNFSGRRRLLGGNGFDTLRLDGSGLSLDLTAIADNRIVDIEQIDITGTGNNALTLNAREVLNLSSHSNTMVVRRNAGDMVNLGNGWAQQANQVIGPDTFEVFTQGAAILKIQLAAANSTIVGSFVNHVGYSGSGSSIDTGKVLAKESGTPTLLTYDQLINTPRGINGVVFDIDNLPGPVTEADFVFQMSPTGAFDLGANPVGSWTDAPVPSSVSVIPGTLDRVSILWTDNAIANRWLRITVLANANTGLSEAEVYYIGHLLGETTGPSGSVFTVSFADITPIRSAVGSTVNASSPVDIDKNGTVAFADISAMRPNVGAQLTTITIPAAGSGGGGSGSMANTLSGVGNSGTDSDQGLKGHFGVPAVDSLAKDPARNETRLNTNGLATTGRDRSDTQSSPRMYLRQAQGVNALATSRARDRVFAAIGTSGEHKLRIDLESENIFQAISQEWGSIVEEIAK